MLHLIAKPQKKKKAKKLYEAIEARLTEAGVPYEFHLTEAKEDGKKFGERYSEEGNVLVVVGGDGTLNDVFSGMDVGKCPLGLIPAGTGNDFAASAKIPHGLPALDLILNGEPKPTDYIAFSDGRRSLNIAGMGIDVDILTRCERMKHFHAKSKYFLSLIASLFKYHGSPIRIRANGEEFESNFLLAALCNGRQFGGGIPICPPASIDDGKLEIIYADCPRRIKIPFALLKLMKGKVLDLPIAHRITCEEAEFLAEPPFTVQYDGELYEAETFSAKVGRDLLMFRG